MSSILTSGVSTMDKGVETYVFGWSSQAVAIYSRLILDNREYRAKSWLCDLYMHPDRPSFDHLISVRMDRGYQHPHGYDEEMYTVTLKIRRGHLTMASFLKRHLCHPVQVIPVQDDLIGTTIRFITLHCMNCGTSQDIMDYAFPPEPRRWLDRS